MKKLLLSLLVLSAIPFTGKAQSYMTQSGDTLSENWNWISADIALHNRVKSNSATPVVLHWRITKFILGQNWTWDGLCDNFNCYSSTHPCITDGCPQESEPYTNAAWGDLKSSWSDMVHAADNTFSLVRMQLKDKADTTVQANWRTLTFIGYKINNSVSGTIVSQDDIVVFPNPANGKINISTDENSPLAAVALYSPDGTLVRSTRINGTMTQLETTGITSGVYFLRLLDAEGRQIGMRKITHL